MKSDGLIKKDVYRVIKGSALEAAVSGKLSRRGRPAGSNLEDIVISVLDNGRGQIQEAFVNVNIYVPDIQDDTKAYVIHDERVDELSAMAIVLLEVHNGGEFRFEIDKQRVFKVDGKDEHFINNKLLYRQCNEVV
jgi:hypothetical protein